MGLAHDILKQKQFDHIVRIFKNTDETTLSLPRGSVSEDTQMKLISEGFVVNDYHNGNVYISLPICYPDGRLVCDWHRR